MPDYEQPTRRIFSVSELNDETKKCLEQRFVSVFVRGEVSNFSAPRSGHWYFTLKDESAQIRVVMFRNANTRFQAPNLGDELIVGGQLSFYRDRGEVQIIAHQIRAAGLGDLQQQFDDLKKKLLVEGLFDQSRKKLLPPLPKKLGVITSPSGAVIEDIRQIMARRAPSLPILIVPSRVQGAEAISEICSGITLCDQREDIDLIVIARGGGSLEDLIAFNSEAVSRAIARCETPIISAVGHETDTSMTDFVADVRASTPSEAAEILTTGYQQLSDSFMRQKNELESHMKASVLKKRNILNTLNRTLKNPVDNIRLASQKLDHLQTNLDQAGERVVTERQQKVYTLRRAIDPSPIRSRLLNYEARISNLREKLTTTLKNSKAAKEARFVHSLSVLEAISPLKTMSRGYSIAFKAEDTEETLIDSVDQINVGDNVEVRLSDGRFRSKVTQIS